MTQIAVETSAELRRVDYGSSSDRSSPCSPFAAPPNVHKGSLADIESRPPDVRFTPETGHFGAQLAALPAPVADGVNADQDEKFTLSRSRSPPMLIDRRRLVATATTAAVICLHAGSGAFAASRNQ